MTSFPESSAKESLFSDSATWLRNSRSLQRIALAVVGDEAAAEDVVQNAWLEHLRNWRPDRGMGWLRSLVRSRSIDALRVRERGRTEPLVPEHHSSPERDDLEARLGVQRKVLEAVDALDEPYRTTLYLRYFEDLGPRAIAARLRVPEGTVKTRLTRAHRRLRDELRPRLQDREGRWAPALIGFATPPPSERAASLSWVTELLLMKKVLLTATAALAVLVIWSVQDFGGGEPVVPADSGLTPRASARAASAASTGPAHEAGPESERAAVAPSNKLSEPSVASDHGSLAVRVVRANGDPAAAVHVIATAEHESRFLNRKSRRLTNAEGYAHFDELPAGPFSLSSVRSSSVLLERVEIQRGEVSEVTVTLPVGLRVVGRVRDASGRGLPGAGVWLASSHAGWASGAVVARTDANGSYELDDIPQGYSLGALADGFQPSELIDLDLVDTSVVPVALDLQLAVGGAQLSGVVRDVDGRAIQGALVALGSNQRFPQWRSDESTAEAWCPRSTYTDASGRYHLDGLRAGDHEVQARSADHALETEKVNLSNGARQVLNLTLRAGARIRGTLTTIEGETVARALVVALEDPHPQTYLQGGQVNYIGALTPAATFTDDNGGFELSPVTPGRMTLLALEPKEDPHAKYEVVRFVREELTLRDGDDVRWDPVLSEGRVIEGRVLYRDGGPITRVYVMLTGPTPAEERTAFAEDGSFRFLNLGPGPFDLRVQMWARPEGAVEPYLEGIHPRTEPFDVVAEFDSPAKIEPASVDVRLIDTGERTLGKGSVVLESVAGKARIHGSSNGDRWTFEVRTPGAYRAVALTGARVVGASADFEVRGGERLALPDLVTVPGGTLLLQAQHAEPAPTGVRVLLRVKSGKLAEAFELNGMSELRLDNLEPGQGRISFHGDNIRQLELEFEIRSGEETVLPVPFTPAVPVLYRIEWPRDQATGTLSLRFVDRANGEIADHFEIADLASYSSPIQWAAYLPVGTYRFEVSKNGSPYHSEEFEVTSLDPTLAPAVGMR